MSDDLVKRLREDQPVTQDMVSTMQCALQDAAADRIEELEAKLAKAVAGMMALTDVSTLMQSSSSHNRFRHNTTVTDSIWSQWSTQLKFARTTLAELTGGKDE